MRPDSVRFHNFEVLRYSVAIVYERDACVVQSRRAFYKRFAGGKETILKILVFSDAHGVVRGMEQAMRAHERDMDAVIFLGDGIREAETLFSRFPNLMHTAVLGNNDFGCAGVEECVLELEGVRVFCTHGHRYGVKSGIERLLAAAQARDAGLVLYGHTHMPEDRVLNGIRLFNPGTVGCGRDRTYGVVHIEDGRIVAGVGTISLA